MKTRKNLVLSLILLTFLVGIVSATFCCEKTALTGARCQNVNEQASCNSAFQVESAFCEVTSFCKLGTCIDGEDGLCGTSAKSPCETDGGTWVDAKRTDVADCANGCCYIGSGASFTTQAGCNAQSRVAGVTVNYKASINDEQTCLASASPQARGACSYNIGGEKNCSMTTKEVCNTQYKGNTIYSSVSFAEGMLCSAPSLNTKCEWSNQTTCVERDVYFMDTCGNIANIYDATKIGDLDYWTYINNTWCTGDVSQCGKCSYTGGTVCKEKEKLDSVKPLYGDYMCKSINCDSYRGLYKNGQNATATNSPKHGESWCVTDNIAGAAKDSPGTSSFRLICEMGEVTKELCSNALPEDPRARVCYEDETIKSATCAHTNLWQDCTVQTNKTLCEDNSTRDCKWVTGNEWAAMGNYYFMDGGYGVIKYLPEDETPITPDENGTVNVSLIDSKIERTGICLPEYKPVLKDSLVSKCETVTASCLVRLSKPLVRDGGKDHNDLSIWHCEKGDLHNCSCWNDPITGKADYGVSWGKEINNLCAAIGDCGLQRNVVNVFGEGQIKNSLLIHTDI